MHRKVGVLVCFKRISLAGSIVDAQDVIFKGPVHLLPSFERNFKIVFTIRLP